MSAFLTIIAVHFVVLVSPGPDFLLVTRSSLMSSTRSGIFTALGITLGMLVHITYSILGIGFVIAQSILPHRNVVRGSHDDRHIPLVRIGRIGVVARRNQKTICTRPGNA